MTLTAFLGPGARLHHVGVAVKAIGSAATGLEPIHDPTQRVRVAFADVYGLRVELIEPAADDAPIARSIQRGQQLVHLCFEVDDLEGALRSARQQGCPTIHAPVPAVAFGGRRIAWIFHRALGLIELLEGATPDSA